MLKKLTLVAGFGAGYVLGAKAGKERYTQIEAKFRELSGKPAVQNATTQVKATAADLADTAKSTAADTAKTVTDKVSGASDSTTASPVIDLSAPVEQSTQVGAATTASKAADKATPGLTERTTSPATAPLAGAAPSGSAPDPAVRPRP